MRTLLGLLLSALSLMAEFEVSGHLDLNSQLYLTAPESKHSNNFTTQQTLELKYSHEDLSVYARVYAQEDYYDLATDEENKRTFARIDELFLKYEFTDDALYVGKSIKFWGALELRNIVDGFNPDDFRSDMFDPDKLGVWNLTYSHYTDSGEFSLIIKLHEQEQKMPGFPYVYYFLPENVAYRETLQTSDGEFRPSLYLMYSGSTNTEYALDYAFIYENGYDSQRYFTTNATVSSPIPTKFELNAVLVNKFMTYNTLVIDSTLIKLEALYADVEENRYVGDYSHIAFGVEHSLDDFENGATLGLIAEYYSYQTYDRDKYSDLELFETMQNDIFLGARYTFNNDSDTAIVGGVVADFEYNEETYYAQFESRVFDDYKVAFDYYYINPSTTTNTAYALLGEHQRVALNIAWHF